MVSLFGRNDDRVDEIFGRLTRRLDLLEFDKVVTLESQIESQIEHQKHTSTSFGLMENRLSVLQAKISTLTGMQQKQAADFENFVKAQSAEKLVDLSEVMPVVSPVP